MVQDETEVAAWDRRIIEMMNSLRDLTARHVLTPDQYEMAIKDAIAKYHRERERAIYHDLWEKADRLDEQDHAKYGEVVALVRRICIAELQRLGEFFRQPISPPRPPAQCSQSRPWSGHFLSSNRCVAAR